MIFWGLRCGCALRRLLPLVVELRPKGLVVAKRKAALRASKRGKKGRANKKQAPKSYLLPKMTSFVLLEQRPLANVLLCVLQGAKRPQA